MGRRPRSDDPTVEIPRDESDDTDPNEHEAPDAAGGKAGGGGNGGGGATRADDSDKDLGHARTLLPSLPPPPPPTVIPPWLDDRGEFARGGMGSIHRAYDRMLRRNVVLKLLNPAVAEHPVARRRFREEAQVTGQLDHPNIVPIHDLWVDGDGNLSFTMKLVRGDTLASLLEESDVRDRTEHDLERFAQIFLKVCDAVAFAHSRGVIHRDIKPENVMVGSHGQVYLMDWGCAKILAGVHPTDGGEPVSVERDLASETLDIPGAVIGTAAFMAPEQAQSRSALIDERTDVYLLGGLLYAILTNEAPHRGVDPAETLLRARRGEVTDPQDLVGVGTPLPPALCRIAMRALSVDPADRHQNAEALRDDVAGCLAGGLWLATVHFPRGTLIVREGATAEAAYIITEGTCEVYKMEGERRLVLRRMGPGEVFGETAIFTARRRTANVEAVDDVTATLVTRASLERELLRSRWMGSFVRALAERFQELDTRVSQLRRIEEGARVAAWIRSVVLAEGRKTATGTMEMMWSRLAPRVRVTFGLSEDELVEMATGWPDIRIDRMRDVIAVVAGKAAP